MRQSMLRRLNGMEAVWNRLQGGKKLATADADRTRIRDKGGHDLLVDLALLSMTAASLADQRQERGIKIKPLPAAPAPAKKKARSKTATSGSTKPTKVRRSNPSTAAARSTPVTPAPTDELEELKLRCLI